MVRPTFVKQLCQDPAEGLASDTSSMELSSAQLKVCHVTHHDSWEAFRHWALTYCTMKLTILTILRAPC